MEHAITAARRSRCVRKIGAVIVNDNAIVSTGYNGPPANFTPANTDMAVTCEDFCPHSQRRVEKDFTGYGDCVSIHAEINALLFSSREARVGGQMYVNSITCWDCAKIIANSGLRALIMLDDNATYRMPDQVIAMLELCSIDVRIVLP
jgi:dCMP deaminase